MKVARLSGTARILCLLGPMLVGAMLVVALVILPAVRARPRLSRLFARPCVLKTATDVPCPFCGGTRSVLYASRGEWLPAFLLNPLGVLLIAGGPLVALWFGLCAATGLDLGLLALNRFLSQRAVVRWLLAAISLLWLWKIVAWLAWDV